MYTFAKAVSTAYWSISDLSGPDKALILDRFTAYRGEEAMRHLLEVSASLDSMVLGEREIITQVRKAFEDARRWNVSGDLLRLTSKKVIETAKRVFTETAIATRPVSVVSLAWKRFSSYKHPKDAAILLIGAGQTNGNFARFLSKAGYTNVTVANRTLERAEALAKPSGWQAALTLSYPGKHALPVRCKLYRKRTAHHHRRLFTRHCWLHH